MGETRSYIAIDLKSFYASAECVERGLEHIVAQPVLGAGDARRIEQDHLIILPRHDAGDAVARGLGAVGDDADLLPHEQVDERRFADVGRADYGYEARTKRHFTPYLLW